MPGLEVAVAVVAGYLIGAIPSGVLVGRLRGVDPRAAGSGRTGTTNALRTLGPALAALVAALDVAKGAAAVLAGGLIATWLTGDPAWSAPMAGVASVVGHIRSVFIGFSGGRGVATGGGAALVLAPLALLVVLPVFALLVWRTRYVSLGSIAAATVLPLTVAALYALEVVGFEALVATALIGVVVVLAHADNVQRLKTGTERRLGHG